MSSIIYILQGFFNIRPIHLFSFIWIELAQPINIKDKDLSQVFSYALVVFWDWERRRGCRLWWTQHLRAFKKCGICAQEQHSINIICYLVSQVKSDIFDQPVNSRWQKCFGKLASLSMYIRQSFSFIIMLFNDTS